MTHDDFATDTPARPVAARAPADRRPPLWRWAKLNERSLRDLGEALGVSHMTVFNWMLPWGDARQSDPSPDLKAANETLTDGAVTAAGGWLAPAQQDGWAG